MLVAQGHLPRAVVPEGLEHRLLAPRLLRLRAHHTHSMRHAVHKDPPVCQYFCQTATLVSPVMQHMQHMLAMAVMQHSHATPC